MKIFAKLSSSLVGLKIFALSRNKKKKKKIINSARFSKFDAGNMILFQIEVFVKNIKETALARY